MNFKTRKITTNGEGLKVFFAMLLCFVFIGCSYSGNSTQKLNIQKRLKNGGFEHWFHGKNSPPDGWRLQTSGGSTIARESKERLKSSYSIALKRGTSYVDLWQNIYPLKYLMGKTITFSCWAKCSSSLGARLRINDGAGVSHSSYHTGSGGWELLKVTKTIDNNATYVRVTLYIDTNSVTAYFDGAKLVEGEKAIP